MTRLDSLHGNLRLHVETAGLPPGPGVETYLLIHGYGASTFSWRHWAPRLARRGHVVMVDMKGSGRSPKPDDGRYAPQNQAELMLELIAERDFRELTLMGHSLGGGVSLLTALGLLDRGEDRLKRLVVVAGAAYDQRLPPFVKLADHPRTSSLLFRLLGPRRIVRGVLHTIVSDRSMITEEQVWGYAEPLGSPDAMRALVDSAKQIRPERLESLVARYSHLDVPALLMWGRGDRVVPLWVGERLAQDLPRARLHVFDACGHLPAEELPEESWAVLEEFLDGSGAPPSVHQGHDGHDGHDCHD